MHTQNVNTAASESTKTWVNSLSAMYLSRKTNALVELAKIEGDLMMYLAFARIGIETDDFEAEFFAPELAAERVETLIRLGAVTTSEVHDLICSVEKMASQLNWSLWCQFHPIKLPSLEHCKAEAEHLRQSALAGMHESQKPFSVIVKGQSEWPEDDSSYGTYWSDDEIYLGRAWSVAEAMELARVEWLKDKWDPRDEHVDYYDDGLGRDMGPVSFAAHLIKIHDEQGQLVLSGNAETLCWHAHVNDPAEVKRIEAEKNALHKEAAEECRWDNFASAWRLRVKARELGARIVDEAWRGHPDVIKAINNFCQPVRPQKSTIKE